MPTGQKAISKFIRAKLANGQRPEFAGFMHDYNDSVVSLDLETTDAGELKSLWMNRFMKCANDLGIKKNAYALDGDDIDWSSISLEKSKAKIQRDKTAAEAKRGEIAVERHLKTMSFWQKESQQVGDLLKDDMKRPEQMTSQAIHLEDDRSESEDDLTTMATTEMAPAATAESFRKRVFEAGYYMFKQPDSIQVAELEHIAELNRMARSLQPTTLGEWLDHLSRFLMGSTKSNTQKDALKLSLSRIICLVGSPSTSIFQSYLSKNKHSQQKLEEAMASKIKLDAGFTDEMREVFRDIAQEAKNGGKTKARIYASQRRLEIFEKGIEDSEMLQLLDVTDNLLAEFQANGDIKARGDDRTSELTYYRRFASVLSIIFRDTKLELIDGERICKATKAVRKANMTRYGDEDGKQDVTGRKIDLIIGGRNIELSSSEWKKENTSARQGIIQQIKNVRTNKTILKRIEKLPIDDKDKKSLFILGMDWIGTTGYMMSIHALDGGYVAQHVQDLHLPQTLGNLGTFESTLDCLFAFKHHQERLRQVVEAGYDLQRAQEILRVYRTPCIRHRSASPDTLFTPKRKRSRKVNIVEPDEDEDEDEDHSQSD